MVSGVPRVSAPVGLDSPGRSATGDRRRDQGLAGALEYDMFRV